MTGFILFLEKAGDLMNIDSTFTEEEISYLLEKKKEDDYYYNQFNAFKNHDNEEGIEFLLLA